MKQGIIVGIVGMLVLSWVNASMFIEQVYVNPVSTESGGEAIVIRNKGNERVLLENWTLATQASKKDVVLPAVYVWPNQSLLIADAGWSLKKDDLFWRDADYEEALTFDNTNGGVALINAEGKRIDTVGWGDVSNREYVLYTGTPTEVPGQGKSLVRVNETGNNKEDFVVSDPWFEQENSVLVVVNVTEVVDIVRLTLDDESSDEGVQVVIPQQGKKKVKLEAEVVGRPARVRAVFAGQEILLVERNSSLFVGEFFIDAFVLPGKHSIRVYANDAEEDIFFVAQVQRKLRVDQSRVLLFSSAGRTTQASVLVKNEGFASIRVRPILSSNGSLDSLVEVSLDGESFQHPSDVEMVLSAGETKMLFMRVVVPPTMVPGVYKTRLRLEE